MSSIVVKVGKHLNPHLLLPILDELESRKVYNQDQLVAARLEVLNKTQLVDLAAEVHQKVHDTAPTDQKTRKDAIVTQFKRLRTTSANAVKVFDANADEFKGLSEQGTLSHAYLKSKHNVSAEGVKALHDYAKILFDCGKYPNAAQCLAHVLSVNTLEHGDRLNALWGLFASQILTRGWDAAHTTFEALRDTIERSSWPEQLNQLQARNWLMHWGLFLAFRAPQYLTSVVAVMTKDHYLSTIQIAAPHLTRYVTAAVLSTAELCLAEPGEPRPPALKSLVWLVKQEADNYSDALVSFVNHTFVTFELAKASQALAAAKEEVFDTDYFLMHASPDTWLENARILLLDAIARTHCCVQLTQIGQMLGLAADVKTVDWLAAVIPRLSVKNVSVDGDNLVVVHTSRSVFDEVMARTKDLSLRSKHLHDNMKAPAQQ